MSKQIKRKKSDIIEPNNYKLINIDIIDELPKDYPDEFNEYCYINSLKPPNITSNNGDPYYDKSYFGKKIQKEDVIFIKS